MPRESLDRKIHQIEDEILLLGSMVEQIVIDAVKSLKQRDLALAERVRQYDEQINDKRFAIENAILIVMATQQPMAHDLRLLTSMLEINTELERMGDYAKGIAKVTLRLENVDIPIPISELEKMAELGLGMLHRTLGAFISGDANVAAAIPPEDDLVDELYNRVYRLVTAAMIANPVMVDYSNQLMWVAHNLERLADRVTNICERILFVATGELLEVRSSEDD